MDRKQKQDLEVNLLEAVRAGDAGNLREALAAGADADTRDSSGVAALVLAVESRFESCVSVLLKAGADPDATSRTGERALITALRLGSLPMVKLLLEAGADADTRDSSGVPAVILAARLGLEGAPELLLDSCADPDATDERGNALLIHAIRTGNVSLVSYVLGKGADADVSDSNGSPALSVAVSGISVEVVSELVKGGASLDALNEHGDPVLAQAMKRADGIGFEMFTQLLQDGADPGAISMDGTCMTAVAYQEGGVRGPLMLAALARSTSTLPDEWHDRAGVSLLVRAIEDRRFDWIEALTAAGADVHDKNAKGESCMLMAMRDRRSMGALQNGLDKKEGRISKSEDEDAEFNAYEALSKLDDLKNKKSKYDQYEIEDFDKEKMEVDNLVKKIDAARVETEDEADLSALFKRARLGREILKREAQHVEPQGSGGSQLRGEPENQVDKDSPEFVPSLKRTSSRGPM